jgi:molecular chaperone GrpE (heat shock protein)
MLSRLRAWLSPPPPEPVRATPAAAPPVADARIDELATKLQAIARAQAKQAIVIDELSEALAQRHAELLELLSSRDEVDGLLDAIDRLDDARRTLAPDQHELEVGLAAIAGRIERLLAARGVTRHARLGQPPEGRRERVVGSERRPELPEGVIVRVVRSAASRGQQLVREGEVVINRKASS